jgi:hypothetical protein
VRSRREEGKEWRRGKAGGLVKFRWEMEGNWAGIGWQGKEGELLQGRAKDQRPERMNISWGQKRCNTKAKFAGRVTW